MKPNFENAAKKVDNMSNQNLLFFCGARVAVKEGKFYIDPSNWLRLNLLLGAFKRVQLVVVITDHMGSDWRQLPSSFEIIPGQPDFQPRGISSTLAKKILFVLWSFVLPFRFFFRAHNAAAIGLIWLLEPVAIVGLFLGLLWKKPLYSVVIGSVHKSFDLKSKTSPSFSSRMFNRFAAFAAKGINRLIVRKSTLLLVTGPRLVKELGTGAAFSTSVFSEKDINFREDTCTGDRIRWVYSGGVSVQKGVDVFLKALSKARESDDRHEGLLIGNVDPRFSLSEQLKALNLEGHVIVAGKQPWTKVLHLLRTGDVYVFLSLHEGMPKAPLEAMAQGLPVIATATGTEQYLVDGVNGILVPIGDASAVVESVARIVANRDLRMKFIQGGYQAARSRTFEVSQREVQKKLLDHFPYLIDSEKEDRSIEIR